jgi:hypothetical protein
MNLRRGRRCERDKLFRLSVLDGRAWPLLSWGKEEIPSGQEALLTSEPVWTYLWREDKSQRHYPSECWGEVVLEVTGLSVGSRNSVKYFWFASVSPYKWTVADGIPIQTTSFHSLPFHRWQSSSYSVLLTQEEKEQEISISGTWTPPVYFVACSHNKAFGFVFHVWNQN